MLEWEANTSEVMLSSWRGLIVWCCGNLPFMNVRCLCKRANGRKIGSWFIGRLYIFFIIMQFYYMGWNPEKLFLKTSVILGSVHISFSAVIWSYCVISICSLKLSSVCFNLGETMSFLYSVLGMCPFLKHGLLIASVSTHAHSWPSCGFCVHTHIPGLWCGLLFASTPLSDPASTSIRQFLKFKLW